MREVFSRLLLKCLEKHTPGWVRSMEAQILLNLASRSFHLPGKQIWFLAPENALKAYAEYTADGMKSMRPEPKRLFQKAYRLGNRIRRVTGFTKESDLQRLIFYLYRNIDISMSGCLPGEITMSSCYFSALYTPRQCRLMSYVDSGIIVGLFHGGRLKFSQRLTEGCEQCRACFRTSPRCN